MSMNLYSKMVFLLIVGLLGLIWTCSKSVHSTKVDGMPNIDSLEIDPTDEEVEYYNPRFLRYRDYVYEPNIKTVLFHKENIPLSLPVIDINKNNKLILTFDDLDGNVKDYYYSVVHCDASWRPSDLDPFDYVEGFLENKIYDYQFSFNTSQKYTHYKIMLPNTDISFSKSGNYLLKIYLEGSPEDIIITKQFMVVDQRAEIEAHIRRSGMIKFSKTHQEINFSIDHSGIYTTNPFEEFKVRVMQNRRWDNQIPNLKPKFVQNNRLIYEYDRENLFAAGKEFRRFDMRSFRFLSERVTKFEEKMDTNHVHIHKDEVRSYKHYFYFPDLNGHYIVGVQEGKLDHLEADYAKVHFYLPFDSPLTFGNLYVFGSLTNWDIYDEARMNYDYQRSRYHAELYLKQGFYNYKYIFVEDGSSVFDEAIIEGNYFETENDYTIFVYFKSFTSRYDQLVGFIRINSLKY